MKTTSTLALLVGACALAASAHAQLTPKNVQRPGASPAAAPAPAPAANDGAKKDPEKEAAGQLAAAGWLTLLDRKDWGSAWERSASVFRQNVPLGTWMDAIPKTREPLGALVERKPAAAAYKTTLAGRPDGHYVTVVFQSKFEKKEDAQETVTATLEADGKWHVMGYQVK